MRSRASLCLAAVLLGACGDSPPRILSTSLLAPTTDALGPYVVRAVVEDDRAVEQVSLAVLEARTPQFNVNMRALDDQSYEGEISGFALGSEVMYIVLAGDSAGQTARSDAFTFTVGNVPSRPELLAVWPASGPSSGGTRILLVGRDLRGGLTVELDENFFADEADASERTQAHAKTPPHAPGLADVIVTNADGGRAILSDAFTYFPAPEIERIEPPSGPTAGGTRVTISGRRFAEGMRFLFAGAPATDVAILSDTRAQATTPPGPIGFVSVRVEHDTLGFGVRENAYEYIPPPEVIAIEPARGPDLGGTEVLVRGRYFQRGAALAFDDRAALDVRFLDDMTLAARTPQHPIGFADVRVTNPDAQSGALPDGFFFYGPPEIYRLIAPFAAVDGGARVVVAGANFEMNTTIEMEAINGLTIVPCIYVSTSELQCTTPSALPGPGDVRATNPDGRSDTLANGITYFTVTDVVPERGPASGGTQVAVSGLFLPPSCTIYFGVAAASCRFVGETRYDCVTPPGPPDSFVDVGALPAEFGQVPAVLEDGYFYVAPPEIDSIEPDKGPTHGGTRITIRGDHFQPGATVMIGGAACLDVVVVSETEIQCTVPPGTPGLVAVTVTNPDRQSATFIGFEYVPVTFEPKWGLVDGFVTLTIHGVEFAPNATVRLGNVALTDVTWISNELMTAKIPGRASTGSVEVSVQNPGDLREVSPDRFSYRRYRERTRVDMAGSGETSEVMIHDLDNDGDSDFVFVNGTVDLPGESEILENAGGAFFSRPLGFTDVAHEGNACDFNGDGLLDLVWGTSAATVRIFRNDGALQFTPIIPPGSPGDAFETSFHDVTGDGRCDLININISGEDTVLRNDGGTFRAIAGAFQHEADFIHDHKIDTGDLDGDGDADLILVVDDVNFIAPAQRHRVYLNDGNGRFSEDLQNQAVMMSIHGDVYDVRIGDLDLDGDLDVVAPNFNQAPVVLINNGRGGLTRVIDRLPEDPRGESALVLTDLEGDGDLDLYLVSLVGEDASGDSSRLFLNDGTGRFHRAVEGEPQLPPGAYRAAVGDIDGDGTSDLLLGVVFGANQMYFALE